MARSTDITSHVSTIVKLYCFLIVMATFFACCSCIDWKPTDTDDYYPIVSPLYESRIFERAAPRLGRAAPRLGRASPRIGRRFINMWLSQLPDVGRYYNLEEDTINRFPDDIEPSMHERRATPRLGRSIKFDFEK
ncbi:unnamed protein product [Rotaria magnacalcarata]|uniref:Uncharacterized protein n=2 Tax=Rotaria magnacalcarata TaxID=392030 RepID=A0A816KJK0_9BILA|nr:unnamed protein product [Rotaria magnacalcarata]CAF1253697.1 unnamed protein product [Rotaria magnacalcarata]CAF1923150.1 unnamed protein product [Rotaria magnacalcarata]CAF1932274.1 unnamed protein product [Rotaria magnacalcarata]CAF1967785.1 unnamed protein product [Rotaria magnacalcarata]